MDQSNDFSTDPLTYGVMVFLVVTNPSAPRGFIYFQF